MAYSQNGFELQDGGTNLDTWGDPHLNNTLKRANYLVAGSQTIALTTATYTLTSSNSSTSQADFQAWNAILKFTGAPPSDVTITVPSIPMRWMFHNATSKTLTFTTGAGTTMTLEAGDKAPAYCDGSNVSTIGFGGYQLKDFIAASVLSATGSLPATAGNAGKFLYCDGSSWFPKAVAVTDLATYAKDILGVQVALAVAL